jgi:hypothetical protein
MHAKDKDRVWTEDARPWRFGFEKWTRQFQGIGVLNNPTLEAS